MGAGAEAALFGGSEYSETSGNTGASPVSGGGAGMKSSSAGTNDAGDAPKTSSGVGGVISAFFATFLAGAGVSVLLASAYPAAGTDEDEEADGVDTVIPPRFSFSSSFSSSETLAVNALTPSFSFGREIRKRHISISARLFELRESSCSVCCAISIA